MAEFTWSRTVLEPIAIELWQPGETAPINATGWTGAVEETTLPWQPAVIVISAVLGQVEIAAPTAPQAALLRAGQRYGVQVVFRDGSGAGVFEFDLTVVPR
ncbi:MAG: hypothetical protein ABL914_12270 [Novosphingobium sp.]|uniref:hypothetical protein n=1 Tax=Novosphingobium sp. TaxID=1874826 RepID=UPI0032BE4E56